jgi:hypothetical protein
VTPTEALLLRSMERMAIIEGIADPVLAIENSTGFVSP